MGMGVGDRFITTDRVATRIIYTGVPTNLRGKSPPAHLLHNKSTAFNGLDALRNGAWVTLQQVKLIAGQRPVEIFNLTIDRFTEMTWNYTTCIRVLSDECFSVDEGLLCLLLLRFSACSW